MDHGRHWGLCLLLFWDFCLTEVCRYQRDLFRSWQTKALSRRDPDWKGVQVRESLSVQRPEGVGHSILPRADRTVQSQPSSSCMVQCIGSAVCARAEQRVARACLKVLEASVL